MLFIHFFKSSIGKKWIMACSGSFLILFLCSHAAGNATLFHSMPLFQDYADQLHSHPLIISFLSNVLFLVFVIHIVTGVLLFLQNRKARGTGYRVQKRAVKYSQASRTMIFSGFFILLYILIHTYAVSFGDHRIISLTISYLFSSPLVILFYITSFIVLAIHITHGFWSMLQTFGVNHPKYNTLIRNLTYIVPVFFLLIFSAISLIFIF
ncbi:succinate dehydrogenase cytochrome b subunit [Desulfocapsa sp. AH-315-G09]|uniref:Succinate dehydrogenase cytochrome b subunit n=1 Tax=Desulfotalea psychrophila TaxID=84980 RepID=A0ABS3ATN6_9BACT|nr:succinate dehydrogenase cytochrome b subunit [Desulfocapsa sp.]MBN4052918.1 succinate dehydrogenase cytochrome b subunit [bacterium AH-315-K15]MBN4063911.1 succinate dehydrogenase cytochrome b subunit [bacterium AH-315-I07]MBN4065042.1 succinate dehydrogenase cytochrome b subunit [Desulfocapsa sp. AH-315-G09]MBN4068089.1 succinate dehydrogenase cytochrome b subunit [Desulfotalea psychrophila]